MKPSVENSVEFCGQHPHKPQHEFKKMMWTQMNSLDRWREKVADCQRLILLFGVPVVLLMVLLVILGSIYVIHPYTNTSNFTQTVCQVQRVEVESSGSCSVGSDMFYPCVKIVVLYSAGWSNKMESVIMENEQALATCDQCSYTFGRNGLFHQKQMHCEDWKENFNTSACVERFLELHGSLNTSYTCFFNPNAPSQVIRRIAWSFNSAIHLVTWPFLFCVLYGLSYAFVVYSKKQSKMLGKSMLEQLKETKQRQMAARQSLDRTKKRLSQALGVVPTDRRLQRSELSRLSRQLSFNLTSRPGDSSATHSAPGSIRDLPLEMQRVSCSDMRHLDLAVSERNVDALTALCDNRAYQGEQRNPSYRKATNSDLTSHHLPASSAQHPTANRKTSAVLLNVSAALAESRRSDTRKANRVSRDVHRRQPEQTSALPRSRKSESSV